jgi:hypothetical protein
MGVWKPETDTNAGDVLHFLPEKLTMLVVMSNEEGIRYIEPMDLEFDDNGNIITKFATYADISEWTISFGSVDNVYSMK